MKRQSCLGFVVLFSFVFSGSAQAGLTMYLEAQKPAFLTALDPGAYLIDNVGPNGAFGVPLSYSQGPGGFGIKVYENNYAIYRHNNIIHAFGTYNDLVVNFDKPTTAFGAGFGCTTDGGILMGEYAYVVGRTTSGAQLATYANLGSFVGFIATGGDTLASVRISRADPGLGRYTAIVPRIFVGNAFGVPEPGTWALAAVGLVAGMVYSRRVRRPIAS